MGAFGASSSPFPSLDCSRRARSARLGSRRGTVIITLTLNPAIDETVEVERFNDGDTNRVLSIRRDIGGKGINVARVLK